MDTIVKPPGETLYDRDFAEWAFDQADRLRAATAGDTTGLDWDNLAEEIEALARRDRRELGSHIRRIAEHLFKLQVSPAKEPRAGWIDTIAHARGEIEGIVLQSPSLGRAIPDLVREATPAARRFAASALRQFGEPVAPLEQMPDHTPDQITGDWWPDDQRPMLT